MAKTPPAHTLTDTELRQVQVASGLGLTVEAIASILGISKKTLERRLKVTPGGADALLKGRSHAELQVTQTAFNLAVSGKCPTMTIFWLKTRARWKETEVDRPTEDRADVEQKSNVPKLIIDLTGKKVEQKA